MIEGKERDHCTEPNRNTLQHTGQHLISSVFEQDFKMPTLSWWMSEDPGYTGAPCMVELDVQASGQMTEDVVKSVEKKCNTRIREHCSVNVKVCIRNQTFISTESKSIVINSY